MLVMKKILVPTDFSANAMKAATYAAEIAQKTGATVSLLHVIEPVADRIRQPHALHARLDEEITYNRQTELHGLQKSIKDIYPDIEVGISLDKGIVASSIINFAKKNLADLIVMGTTGAHGMKELFLGSVAAGIIGRAAIPVLAIPEEYELEPPDAILFATNHFEENKALLNKIVEIVEVFSAAFHVIIFIDTDTAKATNYLNNFRHLDHYLDFLNKNFPGITFKGDLIEGEEFEEAVERYDNKNEVDIIAMITYPKSFGEKILKKSMTRKMAFHSKIPLLAIPFNSG
jgi:nucleotide-binding universal stress UspA family protein